MERDVRREYARVLSEVVRILLFANEAVEKETEQMIMKSREVGRKE